MSVYIGCELEVEAKRRIIRARNGEEKQTFEQVVAKCKERREKLEEMSLVKSARFDLILKSNKDFNFVIEKDVFNIVESEEMNKDCEFSIKVIKQASVLLVNDFETIDKGDSGDVVTSIEINIEKYIIKKVKESYPNFDIISEEFSPDVKLSKNCVIINGIDGSVNVSKMMPIFATQMAIIRDGICTAAVAYLPFLNELYFADESTAYLNGKKTSVKNCPIEKGLVAATGTERIKRILGMEKYGLILRDYGSIAVAFACLKSVSVQVQRL